MTQIPLVMLRDKHSWKGCHIMKSEYLSSYHILLGTKCSDFKRRQVDYDSCLPRLLKMSLIFPIQSLYVCWCGGCISVVLFCFFFNLHESPWKQNLKKKKIMGTRSLSEAYLVQRKLYRYICLILLEKNRLLKFHANEFL